MKTLSSRTWRKGKQAARAQAPAPPTPQLARSRTCPMVQLREIPLLWLPLRQLPPSRLPPHQEQTYLNKSPTFDKQKLEFAVLMKILRRRTLSRAISSWREMRWTKAEAMSYLLASGQVVQVEMCLLRLPSILPSSSPGGRLCIRSVITMIGILLFNWTKDWYVRKIQTPP